MHDAMKAYNESWERLLDHQFLKNDRYRKRAYICSPLSGITADEELCNVRKARAYMLYVRTMLLDIWHARRTPTFPRFCATVCRQSVRWHCNLGFSFWLRANCCLFAVRVSATE